MTPDIHALADQVRAGTMTLRDYAHATRRTYRIAQGLPPDLTDPGQLERLAVLVDHQHKAAS